ncbi:MAG: hypothetical protein ACYC69_15690 [Thermodesulfovibrionales bacterium]
MNFLVSLRTTLWLSSGLLLLLFLGSFIMPLREEFQTLHTTPLFAWMADNDPGVTWWLYGSIIILTLLAINTLACSIESLIKKRSSRTWLLTISPQVIHMGFLFILLAHCLSSYDSFQGMTQASRGTALELPNGVVAVVEDIRADVDPAGYIKDWSVAVRYYRQGKALPAETLQPNSPSFIDGFGLYIKTVRFEPFPVALIQLSRDSGAPWALLGGIFFLAGMTTLLLLKIRREADQG